MLSHTCVFLMFVVRSSAFLAGSSSNSIGVLSTSSATSPRMQRVRPMTSGLRMGSGSASRVDFLRKGALGVAGTFGLLGLSTPASAGFFDKDVITLEEVPVRTVIGRKEYVKWGEVAPVVARMRADARKHFAATGAQGGRELTSFFNMKPEGSDIIVGLEVPNAKGSPAIADGFTASLVSPPGLYMKDDHKGKPGMAPWLGFMAKIANDGYKIRDNNGDLPMFEVYSGQGGEENVTMYAAVVDPAK